MKEERKFVVKKDAKTDVITYMEYEKLKGFSVKPKKNVSFEDMINVDEMKIFYSNLQNLRLNNISAHKHCCRRAQWYPDT